ncbi:hypothetical protein MBANPS3_011657 [Mucor bainieri]
MIPNLALILFPKMQYGSLIVSAVTTAIMLVSCLFPSRRPGIIGYLCLAAGFVGILLSALLVAGMKRTIRLESYHTLFYGVYNILIYIPVLVLLHSSARQQKREIKSNRYLQAKLENRDLLSVSTGDRALVQKSFRMAQEAMLFTYYSIWGFIAINLVLTPIFYKSLKNTSKRYSLILFNLLTIIAMITNTVLPFILGPMVAYYSPTGIDNAGLAKAKTMAFIGIFLLDLPNALAIVTWFFAQGGKSDRPQMVPLRGEADADTNSSSVDILPTNKHSV